MAHLDAVTVAQDNLTEEYAKHPAQRDQGKIAGLHQAINYGLKRAEVVALDDAAKALEGIRAALGQRAKPTTVLHVDGPLDAEVVEDLKRQWLAIHGGEA